MRRGTFHLLLALSMLLPAIGIGGFLGAHVPESLVAIVVLAASVSAVAGGVLTIWALRLVDREPSLSQKDRETWRKFIFFTGIIAASLYLSGYFRNAAVRRT
jgi:hypothetical protein